MNATIKTPDGVLVRVIEAIDGFKSKFGDWPGRVEAPAETIAIIATVSLTPHGFFLLQSKVELTLGADGKILALGKQGQVFDYGEEGWQIPSHKHSARTWLGIGE
jgi:hypothetical protein